MLCLLVRLDKTQFYSITLIWRRHLPSNIGQTMCIVTRYLHHLTKIMVRLELVRLSINCLFVLQQFSIWNSREPIFQISLPFRKNLESCHKLDASVRCKLFGLHLGWEGEKKFSRPTKTLSNHRKVAFAFDMKGS